MGNPYFERKYPKTGMGILRKTGNRPEKREISGSNSL